LLHAAKWSLDCGSEGSDSLQDKTAAYAQRGAKAQHTTARCQNKGSKRTETNDLLLLELSKPDPALGCQYKNRFSQPYCLFDLAASWVAGPHHKCFGMTIQVEVDSTCETGRQGCSSVQQLRQERRNTHVRRSVMKDDKGGGGWSAMCGCLRCIPLGTCSLTGKTW
jgi:hypothetical protein